LAASWMVVLPVSPSPSMISKKNSIAANPAHHVTSHNDKNRIAWKFSPVYLKKRQRERRLRCLSGTKTNAAVTTETWRIRSDPATPTTPIGRSTVSAIIAAAAIAKKWLQEHYGVVIRGYLCQLGPMDVPFKTWNAVGTNPFFVADPDAVPKLEAFMDELRKSGDSVGAKITVMAERAPVGWGSPVYNKLDADVAAAMMSINAVKGIEIGAGFASVAQRGSEHGDELTPDGFVTNHAGGILGGISTGQDIVVTIAIKPTSSIRIPRRSIDKQGRPVIVETEGRHDPCVGIRATPIAEAMLALVLMDHALLHRAQNADVKTATPRISSRVAQAKTVQQSAGSSKTNRDPSEA
jgi:chorismate synthase